MNLVFNFLKIRYFLTGRKCQLCTPAYCSIFVLMAFFYLARVDALEKGKTWTPVDACGRL